MTARLALRLATCTPWLGGAVLGLLGACSPGGGSGGAGIVVGVQGDELGGFLQTVHYTIALDGKTTGDATFNASELPKEIPISGNPSAAVEVKVDGLANGQVAVTRTASTRFVAGEKKLLRIQLDPRCLLSAVPGGGLPGPTCAAPQTCIAGRCVDDAVAPADLETYAPSWPSDAPDVCKPLNHGDPAVILGTGQTDYLPITDGQTVSLEKGPQGGHHIWIAVRMKNLKQSGSTTTISGVQPGTGLAPPPTAVVFSFDTDEGGYCKLYGITFRLDDPSDLAFYKNFLGKPLDVTAEVKDPSGASAKSTMHVDVAPTLVCPPGDTDPLCAK